MNPAQNKAIVRKYFDMWNTGDVETADEILSPNYADVGHPEIKSIDDVKKSVIKIRTAFPDFQITIYTQISEENTVASIGTVSRSQEGKKVTSEVMWFVRIENERMSELRTGIVTTG
jgi:ketosteroid isomerase-like protein